jgi:hypothetical protein
VSTSFFSGVVIVSVGDRNRCPLFKQEFRYTQSNTPRAPGYDGFKILHFDSFENKSVNSRYCLFMWRGKKPLGIRCIIGMLLSMPEMALVRLNFW